MVEPISLAATAVVLLAPYLVKAGEAFAERAGEALADKTGELYLALKSKFTNDSYAEQTLLRLEESPDSKGRQTALEHLLTEKMEEDSAFADQVRRLIKEAKAADTRNIISYGERSVAIGGDVTNTNINTGDINDSGNR
jgi:hypothetical protein